MANRRFTDNPRLDGLLGSEFIPLTSVAGGTDTDANPVLAGHDAGATVDDIYDHFTDTDGALAANSDDVLPSQKAVKTYVTAAIAALAPPPTSIGIQYEADVSATADADPGAGKLRWNHGTQASATVIYLDDATADGASLTAVWPRLNAGGTMFLQHATNQDTWQIWEFTAINDASGYAKLTVTLWGANGSFADNDPILVTLDKGQAAATAVVETVNTPSNSSGTVTLDFAGGSRYIGSITLGANVTTLAFSNLPGAGKYAEYELHIKQDPTTPRTFALPASHKALGGSDTSIAAGVGVTTVLSGSTIDNGTTWRYAMQESA